MEKAAIDMIETYFGNHPSYGNVDVSYSFKTDGIIAVDGGLFGESANFLIEAKKDKSFSDNKKDVYEVVSQIISYLHEIKDKEPTKYPNVSIGVDNNEIFMIPSIALEKYVNGDYRWDLPASQMHKDTQLMDDLAEDKNIRPVVTNIDENFRPSEFCMHLLNMALEAEYVKIKIGKSSLSDAFTDFRTMTYGTNDPYVIQQENRQQIELFCRTLFGDEEVYAHPKRKNVMIIDGVEYENIDTEGYEVFSSRYDANGYSLKEYKAITSMADTLIAEANRRFKGDYYTPPVWVNKAHSVISNALGDDWKEKYVVWDSSCGTKNLTRDYKFSDLYSSTLYGGELMSTQHFNKDNVAFQYDFLNDDMCLHDGTYTVEDLKNMTDEQLDEALKMDLSLVKKMMNKEPIIFFGNPPYGSNGNGTNPDGRKGDVANTALKEIMLKNNKGGHAAQELYTQFIYRVQLLAEFFEYGDDDEFHFFFFFNKGFLTSPSFNKFVSGLTAQFSFHEGFMINAGEFDGTSAAWGIIFSHWSIHGDKNQLEFPFEVLESTPQGEVNKISDWTAKRVQKGETISDWLKEISVSKEIKENYPLTKNGWDAPTAKSVYLKPSKDAFGYAHNHSTNIQYSKKYIGLYSFGFAGAHGRDITKDNFERISITFSIRRAVQEKIAQDKQLWIRDKDIFTAPSDDLVTDEFTADCVVYSLFDTQSNQTSLRNYQYKDQEYRVENEFFPFNMKFIEDLAIKHKNMDIQSDITGEHERFIYTWLQAHEDDLSIEANALLEKAKELYEITFSYRDDYAKNAPRYQTNSWDAGYAQIAKLAFGNERINDEFLDFKKEFYNLRTALGEKIAQAAFNDGVI